jgi:pimeloyl-ACP methyl ester carboxylesterase
MTVNGHDSDIITDGISFASTVHSVMPKSERKLSCINRSLRTLVFTLLQRMAVVVWENTGHAINIQHPERFNELLQRVWDEAYLEV